jgi:hypothetical protein
MRRTTGSLAGVALALMFAACDDGRMDNVPGAEPGLEPLPAETPWDTLHPPLAPTPADPQPSDLPPAEPPPDVQSPESPDRSPGPPDRSPSDAPQPPRS